MRDEEQRKNFIPHPSSLVGWLCTYAPEELFVAAGLSPVRLSARNAALSLADSYLHPNLCPYVRYALEAALTSDRNELCGFIGVNSCEALRRLDDVWARYVNTPFFASLDLPHTSGDRSVAFLSDQLKRLKEKIERFVGRALPEDDIRCAIRLMNRIRRALADVYSTRKGANPPLNAGEVFSLVELACKSNKATAAEQLEATATRLKNLPGRYSSDNMPRLMIVGSVVESAEILDAIESVGAMIVMDDLCSGYRYFSDPVDEDGFPLKQIAARLLRKQPCARSQYASQRLDWLFDTIAEYKVDAVVYYCLKFCDTHLYDAVVFRDALRQRGIPFLRLETDFSGGATGQVATRVGAFLESLVTRKA